MNEAKIALDTSVSGEAGVPPDAFRDVVLGAGGALLPGVVEEFSLAEVTHGNTDHGRQDFAHPSKYTRREA